MLVLANIAQGRSEIGRFAPGHLDDLFDEIGLPRPKRISNQFASLEGDGLLSRVKGKGRVWKLTPKGVVHSTGLFTDVDLAALIAETAVIGGPSLGSALHPVIPPSLAPPELIPAPQRFLTDRPFDLNVFGMTRFPDEQEGATNPDLVAGAVEVARDACAAHGLESISPQTAPSQTISGPTSADTCGQASMAWPFSRTDVVAGSTTT